jgi:hypothetical protein
VASSRGAYAAIRLVFGCLYSIDISYTVWCEIKTQKGEKIGRGGGREGKGEKPEHKMRNQKKKKKWKKIEEGK